MFKYRLAYFRPGDEGGGEDVDNAGQQDQKPDNQLPEGLVRFLKNNNLVVNSDDPAIMAALSTLWKQSGKNARDAESQRKRAQDAESRLSNVSLEAVIGSLDDESKVKFSALIDSAQRSGKMEASVKLLAEAGVKMTPEMYDLALAGPEATKAFIAAASNGKTQQHDSAPNGNNMEAQIMATLAKIIGMGADQQQQKQDQQAPKDDPLAPYTAAPTLTSEALARMKEAANKTATRSI